MKRLSVLILAFLMAGISVHGRDVQVADSCLARLRNQAGLSNPEKSDLLFKIITNHNNDDTCAFYSDCLIELAGKSGNTHHLFYGMYCKAQSFILRQQTKEAIPILYEALKIAQDNDLQLEIGFVYYCLSDAYYYTNNIGNSTYHLGKAIDVFTRLKSEKYLYSSLYQLGNIYFYTNINDSALYFYKKALVGFENQTDSLELAHILGNIGALQSKSNQTDSARANLYLAIDVLSRKKDYQPVITYYVYASKNEMRAGQIDKAKDLIEKAYRLVSMYPSPERRRIVYEQLSNIYQAHGDYHRAFEFQEAYYTLRDSMVNLEVVTQMANLRTEFEVNQKQQELDKVAEISQSKSRMVLVSVIGLLLVSVLLVLVMIWYRQKVVLNRKLQGQKKKLAARKVEMEEANHAKDRLFSIISHDLRGPVGAIKNLAGLIVKSIDSCRFKDAEELAVSMSDASQQVEFLLDNLLHWSISQQKLYQPRTDGFELNHLVNEVLKVYIQSASAKKIQLIYNPYYSELVIESDSNCWATIIRNLVNNAIKFTHIGGRVEVSAYYNDGYVYLKVTDNGLGMTSEQVENLFSFAGKNSGWGTQNEKGQGLGLCLVNDFVTMQNGNIEVHSQSGKGTCFIVTIPARLVHKGEILTQTHQTPLEKTFSMP